jgi:hypothetical protein
MVEITPTCLPVAERHHVGHDRRPVGMTEGRVVDEDVFCGMPLVEQILLEDLVGRARIDVVGAQKREALDAQFLEEVVDAGIACWFGAAPV